MREYRFKLIVGRSCLVIPDDVDWRRDWMKPSGVSTVLPGLIGIHQLINIATTLAVTLSFYGPGCDGFLRAAARTAA